MANRKFTSILVILVAVAMVLSSAAFLFPGGSQSATSSAHGNTATANAVTQGAVNLGSSASHQKGASVLNALHSKGIPNKDIYMPNFNAAPQKVGSLVNGPSYTTAPAPMGIGTYGFSNNGGVITRNNISTNSFEGSVTFQNFSTFSALNDAPNSVTVQLNDILNNVTLFGQTNYTFWNQNVLFYSARLQQIQFLDNIWNFSSPAFYMSPNVFSSYGGNLVSPSFYYTVGPAFSISFPFTVNLYTNTTTMNGDNTVFFNYSVSDSSGSASGSYDMVQFNSTYGQPAGYSAPPANYYVTSYNLTPDGYIPYDAEIMIGGPGGGSTALINDINATMTLKYQNGGNYVNVPNAWNVGSETGETSTGAAVTWTPNGVAHLSAGPSFVYGMWNVSQTNTFEHFSGQVNPPNSFMFASPSSSFNASLSTWTPLSPTGGYSFSLPSGVPISASILMADHTPVASALLTSGTAQTFNLPFNWHTGVYTPLYAYGNSQLKYISSWGTGTAHNPYRLYNNPSPNGMLSPLFGTFNDYVFPQFNGILLHSTTAHVVISSMPNMTVQYTPNQQAILAYYGISYATNDLGYVLYNAQNAVITHNTISGWFANSLTEFPVANLLLWNSQNNVVSNNHFVTMDSSLLIYNMQTQKGHNLVYGNQFFQDQNLNLTRYAGIAVSTTFGTSPYGPVAMSIYSSGNTITGNFVVVLNTAISPFYSIYSGYGATYKNNWNGNFWWNYTPPARGHGHFGLDHGSWDHSQGNTLYNNTGQISYGGDHNPISFPGYTPAYLEQFVMNVFYN